MNKRVTPAEFRKWLRGTVDERYDHPTTPLDKRNTYLELVRVDRLYPTTNSARVTYRDTLEDLTPVSVEVMILSPLKTPTIEDTLSPDWATEICPYTNKLSLVAPPNLTGVVMAIKGDHTHKGSVLLGFVQMEELLIAPSLNSRTIKMGNSQVKLLPDSIGINSDNILFNDVPLNDIVGKEGPQGPQGEQGPAGADGKEWVLVNSSNISSGNAVAYIEYSNLDGDTDKEYKIEFSLWIPTNANDRFLQLKPNNSDIDIRGTVVSTSVALLSSSASAIAGVNNNNTSRLNGTVYVKIKYDNQTGRAVHVISDVFRHGGSDAFASYMVNGGKTFGSNITSIRMALSAGTMYGQMYLYKRLS